MSLAFIDRTGRTELPVDPNRVIQFHVIETDIVNLHPVLIGIRQAAAAKFYTFDFGIDDIHMSIEDIDAPS